jgi:aminopeptidase N/puromycin-sensitive aminopeptidase
MLAEFQDPVLVARSLDYAVSGKVRNQDALLQVANALRTDATRDQAWNFVKSHWSSLQPLLTPELGSILVSSSSRFCSVEARDDVKAYYTEHKVPSSERTLKHALENIDGCIEFRSLQQQNLRKWLAAQPRL